MRSLWLPVVALGFAFPSPGLAQPKPVTVAGGQAASNVVALPAGDPAAVLAGQPVSQPLQPVEISEPPEPTPAAVPPDSEPAEVVVTERPVKGLGDSWDSLNYLLWWPKSQPVPPLATSNRFGAPALGQPGTRVLIGGRNAGSQDQSGGRFVLGRSLNEGNTVGVEGVYFFLGTRTLTSRTSDLAHPRLGNIGLPYIDAASGTPDVLTVARQGFSNAAVAVSTSTRVQGAEFNVVANLIDRPGLRVNALTGYRFFQLHEGLHGATTVVSPARDDGTPYGRAEIADQFDAHNRFSGGQLGFSADATRGYLFAELTGKLALGGNYEVVKVGGRTNTLIAYSPAPLAASYPSGVYAQPTNSGRVAQTVFAVVPETFFKVGLQFSDRGRFYCGYNFLYLSDAVRPGDQLDRTVNPAQIRLLNPAGSLAGPDRPGPLVNRSDFWVQGLVVGLEGRY